MRMAKNLLMKYIALFPGEAADLSRLLNQMSNNQEITSRNTYPGHVTASGIVIHEGKI